MTGVQLVNVHALGGSAMLHAAAQAISAGVPMGADRPRLLAVTVLTSMDAKAIREVGIGGPPKTRVVKLAKLAKTAGVDGVVASVQEARAIRKACGRDFLIVTPGVRPAIKSDSAAGATGRPSPHRHPHRSHQSRRRLPRSRPPHHRRPRPPRRRPIHRRRNLLQSNRRKNKKLPRRNSHTFAFVAATSRRHLAFSCRGGARSARRQLQAQRSRRAASPR